MTLAFIEAHQFSNSELTQLWKTNWYIPYGFTQTLLLFLLYLFFFQILSAGVCFRISSREFWTEVIILWQYVYIWPQRHTPRICNKNSDYVIMAIRFLIYKKDLIHVLFLTFLVSGKSCVLQFVSQTMSKTLWFYGKFQVLILTT